VIARRVFVAGTAAALAAGTQPARAALGDSFTATTTLGVIGPFSGKELRLGEQLANGVRQAIDDANRIRGGLDRAFAMRTFDDENLLAAGIVTAQFSIDDPNVACVIGHLSGRVTDGARRVYLNSRMPLIVPASSYDRITAHGATGVYRLPTKDSIEGQLAAKFVGSTAKPKLVAVLSQDGDYGYDVAVGFQQQADADKLAVKQFVFSWEKPNFGAVAKDVLTSKPDAVFLAGLARDMGPIVHELRAGGYQGPLFGSNGFFDALTTDTYGADTASLTASASMPPLAIVPTPFRVRGDFERRYGAMTPLSAFGYAAAQIAIAAARRSGAADRLSLARALVLPIAYATVVGPSQFGPTGDPLDPNASFYTVADKKWKSIRAAHPSAFILK